MAIQKLDELIAKMPGQSFPIQKSALGSASIGKLSSLWTTAGVPGAGAYETTLNGVLPTKTTAGAIPFNNPTGALKTYLARAQGVLGDEGMIVLFDRLWHNRVDVITDTAEHAITFPGATRYSNGQGVELWAEIQATLANTTAATWTAKYTDQDGNTAQVATYSYGGPVTTNVMFPFVLAAGDTGVRAVSSFQTSVVQASGNLGLVLMRRLAEIPIAIANVAVVQDAIALGLSEIKNDACLSLAVLPTSSSTGALLGRIDLVQG